MKYEDRGASADKADVHAAIKSEDKGLFPGAFCKVLPDTLTGSPDHCLMVHADGAGTKSILAYFHYRETGDASVFRGIAQDSLIMNIDDLVCAGARGPFLLSNTIGRNAKIIPGDVIAEIIAGYRDCIEWLERYGLKVISCGGETADVGDVVRTLIVDSTVAVRELRSRIITCNRIRPGLSIVGLYSGGRAVYENRENSGLGSNGFTAVRHEILSSHYKKEYPEAFAPEIVDLAYTGRHRMSDSLPGSELSLGEALLSPTRTYAPVVNAVLDRMGEAVAAIFNNTGGGQTKCLRFGSGITYIKDHLFPLPPIFKLIRDESSMSPRELFRTLNMGHRMEIVCEEDAATQIIDVSREFGIDARIVGRTMVSPAENRLELKYEGKEYSYSLDLGKS